MIGKMLGDRYEILELIGEGGMAKVYKAKCHLLNRYVAVKVLRDEFIDDEDFVRKFRRESQAAASLSHSNILNIYDVGMEEIDGREIYYIVMEYIKGETLKEYIEKKGQLSIDKTVDFSLQISKALRNAHENKIIHRDIKPQNIMVTEEDVLKVTDFGIARAATSNTMTTTTSALGSVHYFSPEQARGGYTDEKSDIYSLGIVMYEMVTGQVPYDAETPVSVALKHVQEKITNPREVNSEIPKELEEIILKCVQKHQSERYQNIDEVIKDLSDYKSGNYVLKGNIIDDEYKTQVIPAVTEEINDMETMGSVDYSKRAKPPKKPSKNNENKEESKKGGGFKTTIAAILLAFIVVSASFFGIMKMRDFFNRQKDEVIVPNLLGMEVEEGKDLLEELGLKMRVIREVENDEYGPGQIVSQSEEEGVKVKEGFTIDVVVNKDGEELIKVPRLTNKNIDDAIRLLEEEGFIVGDITYEPSDVIPEDIVLSQDPEAYELFEEGGRINLIVSKGEETKTIIMPNLLGMNNIDAQNKLIEYGFKVEISEEFSSKYDVGDVVWQSKKAGEEVTTDTPISLGISKGPEEVEETEIEETPEVQTPQESNFTINVSPSTDSETVEIKIIRVRNGQSTEVYSSTHNSNQTIPITLKALSGDSFEIQYDGIFQYAVRKD